jgi:hypothetical protein
MPRAAGPHRDLQVLAHGFWVGARSPPPGLFFMLAVREDLPRLSGVA